MEVTGLTNDARYDFDLRAVNSAGEGEIAEAAVTPGSGPSAPGAPQELSAQAGNGQVILSWQPPADNGRSPVTRYEYQYKETGASSFPQGWTNAGGSRSATVRSLTNGTRYDFRVHAVNAVGEGAPSGVSATPELPPAPPAAPELKAQPASRTQMDLSWTTPAANPPLEGFTLQWHDRGTWTDLGDRPFTESDTSYSHKDMTPGTTYRYRIRAENGASSPWDYATAATVSAGRPLAPTLQATADGANTINLSWTPNSDDGGSSVTGYRLQVSSNGSSWGTLRTLGAADTTYAHTGLRAGTTRHYRVAARNRVGTGPWSPVVVETTVPGVPDTPRLRASANGPTQIDLSWSRPANNGSTITHYELEVSPDAGTNWTRLDYSIAAADTSYPHTGLTHGTTRHYRLRAVNAAGPSSWSPAAHATTPVGKPEAPVLAEPGPNTREVSLSWNEPSDNGAAISRYRVEVSIDAGTTWRPLARKNSNVRTHNHPGITPGTTLHYRVAAFNRLGWSPWSAETITTTLPEAPDAPLLQATASFATQIDLSWDAPASNGSPITRYELHVSDDEGETWSQRPNIDAGDTSSELLGLTHGTERRFRLRAVNDIGTGPWSAVVSQTTPAGPPDSPFLRAEPDGERSIVLTWVEPSNNGAAITSYQVQVSADGGDTWRRLDSPNRNLRTHTHRGLSAGTTRHYRVNARNRAGTSEYSNVATATTRAGVPNAPVLSARAAGPRAISLSWTTPADNGSSIEGYDLQYEVTLSDGTTAWNPVRASRGALVSSVEDTGLNPGETRRYRVNAANRNGAGAWSRVVSATTLPEPPNAPFLQLTADGETTINLSWNVPDDNGAAITGYRIERSASGYDEQWKVLAASHRRNSYSDTGLAGGSTWHYRVSAINRAGTGHLSNMTSATTDGTPPGPPGVPLYLRAEPGANSVTLHWDPPADDGGAAITGYRYHQAGPGRLWDGVGTEVTGTSVTIRDLPAGTNQFWVQAVNAAGLVGVWTREIYATPRNSDSPGVLVSPTQLRVREGGSSTFRVSLAERPTHPVEIIILWDREDDNDLVRRMPDENGKIIEPESWRTGVTITVHAAEDADSENGVALLDLWTASDDPRFFNVWAAGVKLTEVDND